MAFEIAVPARYGDALVRHLMVAGQPFGITPYGVEVLTAPDREVVVGLKPLDKTRRLRSGAHVHPQRRGCRPGHRSGSRHSGLPIPDLGQWIGLGFVELGFVERGRERVGEIVRAHDPLRGESPASRSSAPSPAVRKEGVSAVDSIWTRRTPPRHAVTPGHSGAVVKQAGIGLSEVRDLSLAPVLARRGQWPAIARAAETHVGVEAPVEPQAISGSKGILIWSGPDQMMAVSPRRDTLRPLGASREAFAGAASVLSTFADSLRQMLVDPSEFVNVSNL